MILPSTYPICWGPQTDYLFFVGLLGWLFSGAVTWLCAAPRPDGDLAVRRRVFWLVLGSSHALVALACASTLADGFGRVLDRFQGAAELSVSLAIVGVALQVSILPPPRGWRRLPAWKRGRVIVAGATALIGWFAPSVGLWWCLVVATVSAVGLLAGWGAVEKSTVGGGPHDSVNRLMGLSLLVVALNWFVPPLLMQVAGLREVAGACEDHRWVGLVQAVSLAGAGWVVLFGAWMIFLRDRALARIRDRSGMLGLRPVYLLPFMEFMVVALGFPLTQAVCRRAELDVGARVQAEIRAVAGVESWPGLGTDGAAGSREALREPARRFLERSPEYLAAAFGRVTEDGLVPIGVEVMSGRDERADAGRLWPVAGAEDERMRRGEGWVRWPESVLEGAPIVVGVPGASIAGSGGAPWFLIVLVDAAGLDDMVARQRVQMFAIVALAALVTIIAVVYTVRSINETELAALKDKAEAESVAKTEFLAMVSHEVRTPLQSVLGYAELAQAEPLPGDAGRHVRAIRAQGAILLRIVQDILDFSALRGGGLKLAPESVDLRALVDDVHRAFADRAKGKGIVLSVEVEKAVPPRVVVDPVRITQVLVNLVANGIKFTSRGGVRLAVRCAETEDGTAQLGFSVSDTGAGISSAHLRRIFEPFRKLRDDDTPGGGGVGLGLSICQQIVRRLGGEIVVESVEGDGTTFRFSLAVPVAGEEGACATAGPSGADDTVRMHHLAGLEILLVEDNPYVRELMREFLRRLGASVSTRPDGRSALEAVRGARFDVVLLDLRLPDTDGGTLAEAIRRMSPGPQDPWMVGVSAGASDLDIQRALEQGLNDFLLKPVSMTGLAETIALSPAGARIAAAGPALMDTGVAMSAESREAFFAESASVIARMEELCRAGQGRLAGAEAHYLANGCLVLGLQEAFALCRAIEEAAEQDNCEGGLERVRRLREILTEAAARSARESVCQPS